MKPITDINELRRIELEILDHVARFCDERGIKWFLIGGTLIGAVRHKGFVPWDDDIDIGMLRPDYERFVREYPYEGRYGLQTSKRNSYYQAFSKIYDSETAVKERGCVCGSNGVWIDIFPFDGIPDRTFCPSRTRKWHLIQEFIRTVNLPLREREWRLRRRIAAALLLPFRFLVSKRRIGHWLTRMTTGHSVSDSPYIGILVWGYGLREIIPRRAFDGIDFVEFEGRKLPAMSGWDLYLSTVYGDYLTPPPPEKRKSTHDFQAWWNDAAPVTDSNGFDRQVPCKCP